MGHSPYTDIKTLGQDKVYVITTHNSRSRYSHTVTNKQQNNVDY